MRSFIILSLLLATSAAVAQSFNQRTTDERDRTILLGKINQEGLKQQPFQKWFDTKKEGYNMDLSLKQTLKTELKDYSLTLFMGTWCGDSKREVPRIYKILEEIDFPLDRLTTVAVSPDKKDYKQSPGGEQEGLNIHRVPTLILTKQGKEVGRIVESAQNSLEADLLNIIQGSYQPNYSKINEIDEQIDKLSAQEVSQHLNMLGNQLSAEEFENVYELTTYSAVLDAAGKDEHALAVARLAVKLYPEESYARISLGKRQLSLGNVGEAKSTWRAVLNEDPNNKSALELLDQLDMEQD